MANSMLNHIFRPVPDLNNLPEPANKEERLKTIIANLEKQNQDVRASMLSEARQKLEDLRGIEDSSLDTEMDFDCPTSSDHRQFVANMNVSYVEGSGDPCLLHGTIPTVDSSSKQASVPPEVRVAQVVIEQMEAYDKHVKQTRNYYVKALERQREMRANTEPAQSSRG